MGNIEGLKSSILKLLEEKTIGKRVDNELHDTSVNLAQQLLANKFPNRSWKMATENKRGIDVQGYLGNQLDVACEVTTSDLFQGHRSKNILEDLQRLQDSGVENKFLAIINAEVFIQLKKIRAQEKLHGIKILDLVTFNFESLGK